MTTSIVHIPGSMDCREKLLKNPGKTYAVRPLPDIRKIAVHHSLTRTGSAESFARYHIQHHGWPGIGYHFVIEKKGTVKWCNDLTVKSYHVGRENGLAIGICLVGDFRKETLEERQLAPLMKLLRFLCTEFDLRAEDVLGHNEFPDYSWKACPCVDMQVIRNMLGRNSEHSRQLASDTGELDNLLSPALTFDPNHLTTNPGESVIAAVNRLGLFDLGEVKARNKTFDLKKPSDKPVSVKVKGPVEIVPDNLKKLIHALERQDYKVFRNDTRPYNLNIVGIRNDNAVPNAFDDEIHVFWKYQNTWNTRTYKITTDPGLACSSIPSINRELPF
ncbi:MAG: N-acetylmuramoyl-L-alanine amidase [Cyclobacteriaceae bacterium]|nr:N-acetylmuramoyl-L-alanine amidase [Cyclobacteriaceae bacterium]